MTTIKYDKRLVCKHCGSGNITFRTLYIGRDYAKPGVVRISSHWYDCANCKFSSNGRRTLQEAEADANLIAIDN